MKALDRAFPASARVTPETAAKAILKGITPPPLHGLHVAQMSAIGYWWQNKFALPYELVMRFLNNRINTIAETELLMRTP